MRLTVQKRMQQNIISILVALVMIGTIHQSSAADEVPDEFSAQMYSDETGATLLYRWYVPPSASAEHRVPVIFLLHGTSGRGRDNVTQMTEANRDAIAFIRAQKNHPCAIVVPQCPPDVQWVRTTYDPNRHERPAQSGRTMSSLTALMREVAQNPVIDNQRIYCIGNSMGGYGTWDVVTREPQLIAAAIPICGGADLMAAKEIAHIPLWIFHGVQDHIVAVGHARRMVTALQEQGGSPRLTEFPEGGHNISKQVYATDGLAEWLFAQRLSTK